MNRTGALMPLLLAGCMAGPNYEPPELDLPETFRGGNANERQTEAIAYTDWQAVFSDPLLQELIHKGLSNNLDLAVARSRLREAEAALTIARAPLYPGFGLGFNAEREDESILTGGDGNNEDTFNLLGLLSWELDLWGFNRRLAEASRARLASSAYAVHAQQVSLIGAIAATYFNLLAINQQLSLIEVTVNTRKEALRISELRNRSGVISGLQVAQAKVVLAEAEQQLPNLRNQQFVLENQLQRLLGEPPGPVQLAATLADLDESQELPTGVPSELLLRRPDVRIAEAELIAANAEMGAAKADLFPRIALTGEFGRESADLSDLLDSDGAAWILELDIVQPIFNAGARRAAVSAAEERREQSLLIYKDVVLGALSDVSNALNTHRRAKEAALVTERLRAASSDYLRLAGLRYQNGVVGYIDVLDAQRQYFGAQLVLIEALRDQHLATAFLYRALGGGWEETNDSGESEIGASE